MRYRVSRRDNIVHVRTSSDAFVGEYGLLQFSNFIKQANQNGDEIVSEDNWGYVIKIEDIL